MPPFLYWILLGLIAGTLAKFLVPGRDPSGCIITILLGIGGSFIGGLIATWVGWGAATRGSLDYRSILVATVGAMVLLLLGRLARRL